MIDVVHHLKLFLCPILACQIAPGRIDYEKPLLSGMNNIWRLVEKR